MNVNSVNGLSFSQQVSVGVKTNMTVEQAEVKKAVQVAVTPGHYEKGDVTVSEKYLADAIERANKAIEGVNREFKISIHEETNAIMVKVIDKETKEVIREIPPEKILNLVAKLWELCGIIVDEKW